MANLTLTAASVLAGSGARIDRSRNAGTAVTQGQALYLDAATNTYKLADCDAAGAKSFDGIALNAASSGQPLAVLQGGEITIGGTLVPGTVYCVSATAGAIAPQVDITTGDDVVIIGVAKSASVLKVAGYVPGVTL